jgi:pyridoxine/pyridoxamine 5'-phosphate oxidase
MSPTPESPRMPSGYGVPTDASGAALLPWSEAERWLAEARNYWVCTTRADGRPHAAPVWGLWLEGVLVFSTSRSSAKGRNLARIPEIVVHTESGDEVVILEGAVEETELTAELADAYEAKYAFRPEPDADNVWYALPPRVAQTWRERDFAQTATRWVF